MTEKTKVLLLYFILNVIPVYPVGELVAQYYDTLLSDIIYYGFCINLFAFQFTRHCPFRIMAKYIICTDGLNFVSYWNKAYGRKKWLANIIYIPYTIFIFILLFI